MKGNTMIVIPTPAPPALALIVAQAQKVTDRYQELRRDNATMRASLPEAERADLVDAKASTAAGKPLAPASNAPRVQAAILENERGQAACKSVLVDLDVEAFTTLDPLRPEWCEQIEAGLAETQQELEASYVNTAALLHKRDEQASALAFVRSLEFKRAALSDHGYMRTQDWWRYIPPILSQQAQAAFDAAVRKQS